MSLSESKEIKTKVLQYFKDEGNKSKVQGKSLQEVASIMLSEGYLTQDELNTLKNGSLFGDGFNVEVTENNITQEHKTYTTKEKKELADWSAHFLANNTKTAYETFNKYKNSVSILSTDAIVQGIKNILNLWDIATDRNDITTLNEKGKEVFEDMIKAQKLTRWTKDEFTHADEFLRQRGVEFKPENIEKFQQKSEEYVKATAWEEKRIILDNGIKELKELKQIEDLKAKGINTPSKEKTLDQKFVEIIDAFFNNDTQLRGDFIQKISEGIESKKDLSENFIDVLERLNNECQRQMDEALGGKSIEQYSKEYTETYEKAFGKKNSELMCETYINSQKQLASYTQMGIVIATTIYAGSSKLLAKGAQKLSEHVGINTAAQITKATMTALPMAENVALDYLAAITSKEGLTEEKQNEIWEKQKASAPYMIFGSYLAGPLGQFVKNYFKSTPAVLPNIINKAFATVPKSASAMGLSAEIGADTFFHMLWEDASFAEAFSTEASTDASMAGINKILTALIGGRANSAAASLQAQLKDFKIKQIQNSDGQKSYLVETPSGEIIKSNPEDLIGTIFGKLTENGDALIEAIKTNPAENVHSKYVETVGLKITDSAPTTKPPYNVQKIDTEQVKALKYLNKSELAKYYEGVQQKITNTITKNKENIVLLKDIYKDNPKEFAETYLAILAKEIGVNDILPIIKFEKIPPEESHFSWI